jgi:hypothetical protein
MFAGCLQIMSVHLQLMWVEAIGYWQLIRVENTDVCRSCDLCLQVVTAKARGKTGGRPKTNPEKLENARILYENTDKTAAEVCEIAGVGRRKFFSYIAELRNNSSKT